MSTALNDSSRFILAWTLRASMQATDVMETADNGPCYISQDLATYLDTHGLPYTRSAPYHPMTQENSATGLPASTWRST
jgi:putative transposase